MGTMLYYTFWNLYRWPKSTSLGEQGANRNCAFFFCLYIYFLFFIFVLTLKIKGQFSYYGRDIINRIKFTLQWYTNAAQ